MEELLTQTTFEIKTEISPKHELLFTNYDDLKAILNKVKEEIANVVVNDANSYKETKKMRAGFNNTYDEINALKTSYIKDYLNDYETKSKDINKDIKEISKMLDEKIKGYEKEVGLLKPAMKTISFKTYDENIANKIIGIIEKELGIKGEIK